MEDSELVEKLKEGNEEAFRKVLATYQKLVLNCAFKFLRNKESAEDVTQEVFLEVFESIRSFKGQSRLSTWIYRIAVTKSLNEIKHQKRKKRFAVLLNLFDESREEERFLASEGSGPEKGIENQERAQILSRALAKLPESQRIAFALSKVEGMSYEEISSLLSVSIPAVESLLHRAKANLATQLYSYYKKQLS